MSPEREKQSLRKVLVVVESSETSDMRLEMMDKSVLRTSSGKDTPFSSYDLHAI